MERTEFDDLMGLEMGVEEHSAEPVSLLEENTGSYACVSVGPLPSGWGVTIGNPLRRALYREPRGYALAAVVMDDFALDDGGLKSATLSNPQDIVLALRGVRIVYGGESPPPRALGARVQGEDGGSELLPGDISLPPGFKVVGSPERLARLVPDSARPFGADLLFLYGRGYVDAPEGSDPDAGRFLTDRIFSPVVKAEYRVERMRVGATTNYEKLVVSVWTNGTMNAVDAISAAAASLAGWYSWMNDWSLENGASEAAGLDMETMALRMDSVEKLDLGGRAVNLLRRIGAETVGDVIAMSRDEFLMLRGFGEGTYADLSDALLGGGYTEGLDEDSHWLAGRTED